MAVSEKPIEQVVASIPPTRELRERLSQNVRESQLLRKLIRIAEQRDGLSGKPESAPCK
jgi:hypothetical protein